MTAVSCCTSPAEMAGRLRRPGPVPRPVKFIRDIPLGQRHQICRMLDASHAWINLAALLGFTNDDVQTFKQALYRMAGSPTDEMLTVWDYGCHTVTELYRKLFEMKHARCMMLLKDFVDPALHQLIQEVQGIQPADDDEGSASSVHQGYPQIPPVVYVPGGGGQPPPTRKLSPGPAASESHQPHHLKPGQPQATQGSWNGAEQPHNPQQGSSSPHRGRRSEGLTANINKDSSEKVIGLGSPFKDWRGESGSSSFANNKSGNKVELSSGGSGGMASGHSSEMGEKEKLENYQNQSALSLLIHIPHEDIIQATNNFHESHKLGEGSFGTVYHADINMIHYAVKRMKQNEFMGFETNKIARADQMKELRALVTYRSPYIVALCAYCFDGPSPCLVYEYMENGSLEDNLLCRAQRGPLDWRTRHKIAEGAALGINFLHKAQEQPLIHGDIKSANILLGKHMEPKIADFGLARLGPENGKTYCYLKTKNAHGTLPYLPEEFKRNFKLSTKVDVYSFGVVLMEILAGERVADNRREPNRFLTDIVEEALDLEEPKGVIDKIRDRRCPDWPWDIAWHLLDLAVKCTRSKFKQRPEIDEAVNTLKNIAAEIGIRDEMQKHREEYPIQDSQRRSPEVFQDPYHTPRPQRYSPTGHEGVMRYPTPSMGYPGQGNVPMRRDLSVESNTAVPRPGQRQDPRFEASFQRQQMHQVAPACDHGRYPYIPQGYGGPRPGFEPGIRRHTMSETSDENNLVGDDKVPDGSSMSLSSLTSYDMSMRMMDSSICAPLLPQSQSMASPTYHQQSHHYGPPSYDPRHPYPTYQYPARHQGQTPVHYPPQSPAQSPAQYQNPLCSSMGPNADIGAQPDPRYQTTDANFYAPPVPAISSASESTQRRQESLTLQDHMKQLDISQLPTKPIGSGTPQQDIAAKPQAERELQRPAFVSSTSRREPEQNTDIIPGYNASMKEKSVRAPMVTTISEESDEEGSALRSSLTTAEMRQFLSGKSREPMQQTEKMNTYEPISKMSASHQGATSTAATMEDPAPESGDKSTTTPLRSSLTTDQMRQFLSGKREPTEATEVESATNKLAEETSSASRHQDSTSPQQTSTSVTRAPEKSDSSPADNSDGENRKLALQSSLTTTQMRQFLPGRREPSQEDEAVRGEAAQHLAVGPSSTNAVPASIRISGSMQQMQGDFEQSERCYSAPPNMAAPMFQAVSTRREPQQATAPLNGGH